MRVADRGTMIVILMLAAVAALVLAAPALAAPPAASQGLGPDGNPGQGRMRVVHGGVHGRNQHVFPEPGRDIEIVTGKIAALGAGTIGMDGETFRIGSAVLVDEGGRAAQFKYLGFGLKVEIAIENGIVRQVTVFGYVDPEEPIDSRRLKELRIQEQYMRERATHEQGQ